MRDLKGLGASNAARERARGLLGRRTLQGLLSAYEKQRADGKLPATYEVIYGHAWATAEAPRQRGAVQTFAVDRLRRR
jgi:malonyl-CoA O-methyltransferase